MPPRWSRKPDRQDSEYRRLDDRMNFAVHVAVFALCNSGLWFFQLLNQTPDALSPYWRGTPTVTAVWTLVVLAHLVYISGIADYSPTLPSPPERATGFTPKPPKSKDRATKSPKG